MPTLLLALFLQASMPGQADARPFPAGEQTGVDADLDAERAYLREAWRECLFDRADALAGYARLRPARAAKLALAGCAEKARAFRQSSGQPGSGPTGRHAMARMEAEMERYALVVARAAAAVPAR